MLCYHLPFFFFLFIHPPFLSVEILNIIVSYSILSLIDYNLIISFLSPSIVFIQRAFLHLSGLCTLLEVKSQRFPSPLTNLYT